MQAHELADRCRAMTSLESMDDALEQAGCAGWCAFRCSTRSVFLEHFRVPYEVDPLCAETGIAHLRLPGTEARVHWLRRPHAQPAPALVAGVDGARQIPLFARVAGDAEARLILRVLGGSWRREREIRSPGGQVLGSIWQRPDGSVLIPFDPDEAIESFWGEGYLSCVQGGRRRRARLSLMRAYYGGRPLLPRSAQIFLRQRFAQLQARARFPRWPIETCLHDLFDLLFAILAGANGAPIPCMAPWPDGHRWALALTHDVEHAAGLEAIDPILELERAHGVRSSFNLVPCRYDVDLQLVRDLVCDGFEVGVHGVHHDGRDLESRRTWERRLPEAHRAARTWGSVGFRSAALHRHPEWMRMLDFEYDSSWPDTDPFEPQDGGCCSWLPFFNGEVVELPLTLPHDHTLFVILDHEDGTVWMRKTEFLRAHEGLAVIDTHPDYMHDERIRGAYRSFLERFSEDESAWRALPREISAWWRRRAASRLMASDDGWRIVGPAAGEGRVAYRDGRR